MSKGTVNILHLSDLHFGVEQNKLIKMSAIQERETILSNLISTLKDIRTDWKPDVVVISGDIAWKADQADYKKAISWLIELSSALNITRERFVFCPGNHDIDRNKARFANIISTSDQAKEFLSIENIHHRCTHFDNYAEFCQLFKVPQLKNNAVPDSKDTIKYLYGHRRLCDINFVVLNTAWCCYVSNDAGNLWIGERLVLDVQECIRESNKGVTITVFHHPLDYTNIAEQRTYADEPVSQDTILGFSDIILNGHVHGEIRNGTYIENRAYALTSGATYQQDTYKLACQIIKVDILNYSYSTRILSLVPGKRIWEDKEGETDIFFRKLQAPQRNKKTILGKSNFNPHLYIRHSERQLKNWESKNGKLYHIIHEDNEYIPMELIDEQKKYQIDDLLDSLRKNECCNAVLTGDGGIGKTTTCMRLWRASLSQGKLVFYISLSDYNTSNTIMKAILENYGVEIIENYKSLLKNADILLLLDGFNEMKIEFNHDFFQELKKLNKEENIQIIITSRVHVIDFETSNFAYLTFLPLPKNIIDMWVYKSFENGTDLPYISDELYYVLSNPMMLKMYAMFLKREVLVDASQKAIFLNNPTTVGEIVWNLLEFQIIKSRQMHEENEGFTKILLRYLLPYIAYQVEKDDRFYFSIVNLNQYIGEFEVYFQENYSKFDDLIFYLESVQVFLEKRNRTSILVNLCVRNFSIIQLHPQENIANEQRTYGFVHQCFRDVFSAIHIINQMELFNESIFTERILPFHITRMIVEILQEHKIKSYKLRTYLKYYKNNNSYEGQVAILNCLQLISYAHNKNVSNDDFSELNLSMCNLTGHNISESIFSKAYITQSLLLGQGHYSAVNSVQYSSDGKYVISASDDKTVKIWSSGSGKLIRILHHTSSVNRISCSANGKYIVSTTSARDVIVWELETGCMVRKISANNLNLSWSEDLWHAALNSDGSLVVTASRDKVLRLWEAKSGEIIHKLQSHTLDATYACFSPDGTRIVSASRDNTVKIWDSISGVLIHTLEGHSNSVYSASYSNDGKYILSASGDQTIKIWDNNTALLIRTLVGHASSVRNAQFSPCGKYIVSTSMDFTVRLWESHTGRLRRILGEHPSLVKSASFSPDGKYIVTSFLDKSIKIWDSDTGWLIRTIFGYTNRISCIAYSPNSEYIVTACSDFTLKIWSNIHGKLVKTLDGYFHEMTYVAYSPDGNYIVTSSIDKAVKIWCCMSGKLIKALEGHTTPIKYAIYSKDGKYIISASEENIYVWDSSFYTLVQIKVFDKDKKRFEDVFVAHEHKNILNVFDCKFSYPDKTRWNARDSYSRFSDFDLCISPDQNYVIRAKTDGKLTDGEGNRLLVQSTKYKSTLCELEQSEVSVYTICYSTNGKNIAAALSDETLRIWDSNTGKLLHTIRPLLFTTVINADFRDVRHNDLTECDLTLLKQNGAII